MCWGPRGLQKFTVESLSIVHGGKILTIIIIIVFYWKILFVVYIISINLLFCCNSIFNFPVFYFEPKGCTCNQVWSFLVALFWGFSEIWLGNVYELRRSCSLKWLEQKVRTNDVRESNDGLNSAASAMPSIVRIMEYQIHVWQSVFWRVTSLFKRHLSVVTPLLFTIGQWWRLYYLRKFNGDAFTIYYRSVVMPLLFIKGQW